MRMILNGLAAFGLGLLLSSGALAEEKAGAEGESAHTPHYPLIKPVEQDWSFAGPFGHYDKGQLQRGLKVYKEVCSACHSMSMVPFRTLAGLGYSDGQIRALAAEYEVPAEPNADGEIVNRPALPSDHFPSPYPNVEAAAASNNGAAPPDFSLIAKARAVERGFPLFVFDIFTQYAEGGPDYIYNLLTGYTDEAPPAGVEVPEGAYYNPHFISGPALAMAPPLSDGVVAYDDGAPQTLQQYAHDVSAFLMYVAEPHLEARKAAGFSVIVFLVLFAGLVYLTKRKVWADVPH